MNDLLVMLDDEIESINAVLAARDVEGYIAHLEISRTLHIYAISELGTLRAKAAAYDTLRAACKDAPNVIYGAAILLRHVEEFQAADTLVAKADGIAAALAAPANGDGGAQS